MFKTVTNPRLLEWLKKRYGLNEKLLNGDDQPFGPFDVRGRPLHVRHDALLGKWEILEHYDDYAMAYEQRRADIVRLAHEHHGKMPPNDFVKFLILAAIETGITFRADILETVERAANSEAVELSMNTNVDYESIPTEYGEAFIKCVLDQGRGRDPKRHLWWVDADKVYHLQ